MSAPSTVDREASEGPAQDGLVVSSSVLKLFTYSREAEFQSGSSPAASRVLRNLDISISIVACLRPESTSQLRDAHPYKDIAVFGRICTATYPSAMTILYRTVPHLPLLWAILIDWKDMLRNRQVHQFTADPVMFRYLLELAYGQLTRNLTGEDTESYKLRRFFFVCSRVQTLWSTRQSFTPDIAAFLTEHLPNGREFLFPALKKIFWIEKDRDQPKVSLRSSPIEIPTFTSFRPAALQIIDFELHDLSAPLTSVLRDTKFVHRINELVTLLRNTLPNFYTLNLCICRPDYCANPAVRAILNGINTAVLKTGATVTSPNIPLAYLETNGQWSTFGVRENVTVDVVTARGRTSIVDAAARHYYYPAEDCHIFSALTLISSVSFAISYHTNMSLAMVPEKTMIIEILKPFFQERGLQFITIHLESVAMPLFPLELVQVCAHWRRLRYLDLRFKVIWERIEHMPTVCTVRTIVTYCSALEHLYLPELNVLGFRNNAAGLHAFSLRTLTSTLLYSCHEEAAEVGSALLSVFPNMTNVMIEGVSAPGWEAIGRAIHSHLYDTGGDRDDDPGIQFIGGLAVALAQDDFQF